MSKFSIDLPSASTKGLTGRLLVKLGIEAEDGGVGSVSGTPISEEGHISVDDAC